ncbi:hypothetical protein N5853_08550 [Bartonella sp. HY329]|uniref:hypothetical protein n=1 Tax=unclassified Bartonella TaxID=2645622 RepID=UPI0021C7529D|nr:MULTISPECIES: hypothetical protein [unclassified Bartonella]UXM94164.1 hypothetical protein N5853_08550 [Bartonella sp. HY329]UXN08486.1 hypothetical protein N5852_08560 [Bartonella sp. HY328]
MKFFLSLVSTAVIGLALSGCIAPEVTGPINPIVQPQVNRGIEGQWIDSEGVAFSTFHNGIFETRSVDTQEKLSEGNYAMTSPELVSLEMRSLVRGTVSRVNCSLSGNSRLLCTTESGSHFTLARQ